MRAALLAACVLVAAGCGSSDEAGSNTGSRPFGLIRFDKSFARHAGTSSVFFLGNRSKGTPLPELYRVFARAQTPTEARITGKALAVPACASSSDEAEESHPDLGEVEPKAGRILLRGIGSQHLDLVGVGTTLNYVALSLVPDGSSAGCVRPTVEGLTFAAEVDEHDAIVFGLVSDGITAIDLVVDGKAQPARVGENGFAGVIRRPIGKTLDKVVLHHSDGSTTEYPPS